MFRFFVFLLPAFVVAENVAGFRCNSTPIASVSPPDQTGYCKEEKDVCPSIFLPLDRIHVEISKQFSRNMSWHAVNVGANDGVSADPVYPILKRNPHFHVLQVEPNPEMFAKLSSNMVRFRHVDTDNRPVSPSTVREVCKSFKHSSQRSPREFKSLDIIKIDVDGCDCHLLSELLQDPFFHAKVIQIELNHFIPPPISYKEMCDELGSGRSSFSLDVWGCSMQAAYDIVRPFGYELLQHDWPDAVFLHSAFREAFPCLLGDQIGVNFDRNYWVGYLHARRHYSRFANQQNATFVSSLSSMAINAYYDPKPVLLAFEEVYGHMWTKRPLWIEMSAGTAAVTFRQGLSESARSAEWLV